MLSKTRYEHAQHSRPSLPPPPTRLAPPPSASLLASARLPSGRVSVWDCGAAAQRACVQADRASPAPPACAHFLRQRQRAEESPGTSRRRNVRWSSRTRSRGCTLLCTSTSYQRLRLHQPPPPLRPLATPPMPPHRNAWRSPPPLCTHTHAHIHPHALLFTAPHPWHAPQLPVLTAPVTATPPPHPHRRLAFPAPSHPPRNRARSTPATVTVRLPCFPSPPSPPRRPLPAIDKNAARQNGERSTAAHARGERETALQWLTAAPQSREHRRTPRRTALWSSAPSPLFALPSPSLPAVLRTPVGYTAVSVCACSPAPRCTLRVPSTCVLLSLLFLTDVNPVLTGPLSVPLLRQSPSSAHRRRLPAAHRLPSRPDARRHCAPAQVSALGFFFFSESPPPAALLRGARVLCTSSSAFAAAHIGLGCSVPTSSELPTTATR